VQSVFGDSSNKFADSKDLLSAAAERCNSKFAIGIVAMTNGDAIRQRVGEHNEGLLAEAFRQRVSAILRPQDDLVAISEDQVCVILDDLMDSNHLYLAGLKLNRIFEVPVELGELSVIMSVRSGLVYAGRRTRFGKSTEELFGLAEEACSGAVITNKPFEMINATDDQPVDHDWQLNQRVQAAMENHHIGFDYQPKVRLDSGDLAGGEALIRWRDSGGIIPPDEYLAALNEDVLWQLTVYGYRRVLREILEHDIQVPVSFNLDPGSISHPDFLDFARRETNLWGVPAEQIIFEIAESKELLELTSSLSSLESIRNAGFRLSLDEFGTIDAHIDRIRDLPLDEIKLDRSVSGNVINDRNARSIAECAATFAREMNITCVAVGIEDGSAIEMLKSFGYNTGQGFYLGAPMSMEDFATL